MRVKHGTQVRFVLKSGNRILEDTVMDVDLVDGHVTLCGIMYNRLGVSGGVAWWDPGTGYAIEKPKYQVTLVNPDDELIGDMMCDCERCVAQLEQLP